MDPSFIRELEEVMDAADYSNLNARINVIPDNSNPWDGLYVAKDGEGHRYDLVESGHHDEGADVLAWLGIKWPNYEH